MDVEIELMGTEKAKRPAKLNSRIPSQNIWLTVRVRHGYGNTRGDGVTGTHGYGYSIGIWHTAAYRVPVPRCHGYFTGIL